MIVQKMAECKYAGSVDGNPITEVTYKDYMPSQDEIKECGNNDVYDDGINTQDRITALENQVAMLLEALSHVNGGI